MGIIIHERVVQDVDLWNYIPENVNCGDCGTEVEKHISQEGARYHVTSWDAKGPYCSEPNCERNHKH